MTAKIPDGSFGASNIVFGYNAMGQRTNMSDQSGVTTYAYDSRDRLVEKVNPVGVIQYAYDLQGNLTNISVGQVSNFQFQVSYSYDPLNRLHTVLDPRTGLTVYNYDNVGNLQNFIYPNGVSHAYQYDELNRLTNMSLAHLATPIAGYAYALNPSGHRTQVRELGGRTASYGYDNLYRLTQETISGTLIAGQITYTYDAVGNRLGRNSTVTNILEKLYDYDMNDRSGSDSYDAAGNTVAAEVSGQSSEISYTYDFENRITSATSAVSVVQILYDGDGNRVAKTVTDGMGSRRTWYLVDDRSLTGYAQVLLELTSDVWPLTSGVASRVYTYGLDLISQTRYSSLIAEHSFYGYDGHGNVRCLTDTNGYITDTYDYDAFGTLIEQRAWDPSVLALVIPSTPALQSSITPNLYLYCGEQFDPDLGLYFLRARYMDTDRGRFWTMDVWEGSASIPISLHKYLYAELNPISFSDPSGLRIPRLIELQIALAIGHLVTFTALHYLRPHPVGVKWEGTIFVGGASVWGPIFSPYGAVVSFDFLSEPYAASMMTCYRTYVTGVVYGLGASSGFSGMSGASPIMPVLQVGGVKLQTVDRHPNNFDGFAEISSAGFAAGITGGGIALRLGRAAGGWQASTGMGGPLGSVGIGTFVGISDTKTFVDTPTTCN